MRNESTLLRLAFPRAVGIADALWVGRRKRASWAQFRHALPVAEDDTDADVDADADADADAGIDTDTDPAEEEKAAMQAAANREAEAEAAEAAEGAPCVSTSLKSYLEGPYHPHRAADGDTETFWWAEGAPQPGDHLAVRYAPPRDACGVRALTGSSVDGRDRCRACRLSVCIETAEAGECLPRDLGRLGRDGALETRLIPPARVERVELLCEAAQDEWLIVRELGALPCEELQHDEL